MAGKIIEIDTAQLERDRQIANEKLIRVQNELKALYQDIAELDAMWDGPANEAFNRQFKADQEYFEAICQEMRSFIDGLAYAKSEYEKCENQVHTAVNAIRI